MAQEKGQAGEEFRDSGVEFSKPKKVWVDETLTLYGPNGEKSVQRRRRLGDVSEFEGD